MSERDKILEKLNDLDGWLAEFQGETDRAMVVLAVAFTDAQLEELLRSFFIDDQEIEKIFSIKGGAQWSLVQKARVAYLLGLISANDFEDIKTLSKIRNIFAHDLHGTLLESPDITKLAVKLHYPLRQSEQFRKRNREKIAFTAAMLAIRLKANVVNYANPQKRKKLPYNV